MSISELEERVVVVVGVVGVPLWNVADDIRKHEMTASFKLTLFP